MPLVILGQSNFNVGELGYYMDGRADNEVYRRALSTCINWLVLPQGGLFRRPGLEFVYDAETTNSLDLRLTKFSFNKEQEYVQLWGDQEVKLFRLKALVATVNTVFEDDEPRVLRIAQSGDVQIVVHFNHPPQKLERLGSDTSWSISELEIDPLPFFNFNTTHDITPSAATVGTDRTFTLSGSTEGYWNAGHFVNGDIEIKFNNGIATLTEPGQAATGGTAYSSSGTAANAFDDDTGTVCDAGVDGWIGYDFGSDTTIRIVGLLSGTDIDLDIVFETDDNSSFTSATEVGSITVSLVADEWTYIDVPRHTGEQFFRFRETDGGDIDDMQEVVFATGLVAVGDITDAFDNTDATSGFKETAWGEHVGYPRTVEFIGNRLSFGGIRDEPATIFFGKDGDLFNFDDTAANADNAFARTLSTDQNHFIRDMKADRDGLIIFTSDGVFNLDGDGAPITPTNVSIEPQSNIGISRVATAYQDGNLVYNESNGKAISSVAFSFSADQYVSDNKTILAHHLFVDGTKPRSLAGLRNYKDSQANLLFVPREDGQVAVLTQDQSKQVLGWSRFITYNPDGTQANIRDAVVVETDHGDDDVDGNPITIPTVYFLVEREIDSTTETFLEALTEEDVYIDHWYIGAATNNEVTAVAIAGGGTGYAVDDILTVSGGTGTAATLKVREVSSGVITDIDVRTGGDYSVNPTNPVSVTGGGGSGATFTLTFTVKPKTSWSGLTTLLNETVTVVGDGYVIGESEVDGSGNFTTTSAVSTIYAGIPYTSTGVTMKLAILDRNQVVRGRLLTLKEAVMDFYEALEFKVNGYSVYFREWDDFVFDPGGDGIDKFTGQKDVNVSNTGSGFQKDPRVTFTVTDPVSCTLLSLTLNCKVGST